MAVHITAPLAVLSTLHKTTRIHTAICGVLSVINYISSSFTYFILLTATASIMVTLINQVLVINRLRVAVLVGATKSVIVIVLDVFQILH